MKRKGFLSVLLAATLAGAAIVSANGPTGDIAIGATLENFSLPDTAGAVKPGRPGSSRSTGPDCVSLISV